MLLNLFHSVRIQQRQYTVATALPLGAILGLAIGGTVFCVLLAISAIYLARRNDHREREKTVAVDAEANKESVMPLRTIRVPLCLPPTSSSYDPFSHSEQPSAAMSNKGAEDESLMDSPPMTRAQVRKLSQKGLFQMPITRDSWPLTASMPNVPLRLRQPNPSVVTLNQVGGGGYVVTPDPPKWPGRTYSRKSKTKFVVSAEDSNMHRFSQRPYDVTPERHIRQRRSASVNQLSTILRSTSQRLKAAHRKSLSRTLTTVGGPTGQPPYGTLETPCKPMTESLVGLVEPERDASSKREHVRNSSQSSMAHHTFIASSIGSVDSLCAGSSREFVVPAELASPTRTVVTGPQQPATRMSSDGTEEICAMIDRQGQPSAEDFSTQISPKERAALISPHRISLAGDPFYSTVKIGKLALPQNKIIGPRPLYIRQTTFGQEATLERPASFVSNSPSPLSHISGNIQSPSSPGVFESNANPFNWKPDQLMTNRIQQNRAGTSSRKKARKMSTGAGIPILPRPSCESTLPGDSKEDFLRSIPRVSPKSSMLASDRTKSSDAKPSSTASHQLKTLPSSISFLHPVLPGPKFIEDHGELTNDSPMVEVDIPPQTDSPTLAPSYYSEGRTSEEEFFRARPVESKTSYSNKQHKLHNVTAYSYPEPEGLPSLSTLTINTSSEPRIAISLPRLSTMTSDSSPTSQLFLSDQQVLPAPSILTQTSPTPSHLNGPRSEPPKCFSNSSLAPRDSELHQSICMLRRMNSEISRCSIASNDEEEGRSSYCSSPKVSPYSSNWNRQFERQCRGSKAYLSMGMVNRKRGRISKRQSARRNKIGEHAIKEDEGEGLVAWERKGLETMREGNSENPNLNSSQAKQEDRLEASKFRTTTSGSGIRILKEKSLAPKDSLTTELVTPTSPSAASPLKGLRWSDATPSPTIRIIRHESQLLQPSPQSPRAWGWKKHKLGKEEIEDAEDVKENIVNASSTRLGEGGSWKSEQQLLMGG